MAARTKASDVSCQDLQKALDDYMDAAGTRDLAQLLSPLKAMTWKTAAAKHMEELLAMDSLWASLLQLAPTGVLAPTTTTRAVDKANTEAKCNFTQKPTRAFADLISEKIRIALGKFRACRDDKTKSVVYRKLGRADAQKLDKLLQQLAAEEPQQQRQAPSNVAVQMDEDGFPVFPPAFEMSRTSSVATMEYEDEHKETVQARSSTTAGNFELSDFSFFSGDADLFSELTQSEPVTPKEKRDTKKQLQKKKKATPPKSAAVQKQKQKQKPAAQPEGPRAAQQHPKTDKKNVNSRAYHAEYKKRLNAA